MAQQLKYLPHKQEDQISDSQHPCKSQAAAYNPSMLEAETWDPRTSQELNQSNQQALGSAERVYLSKQDEEQSEKILDVNLRSPHVWHTCA